MQPNNIDPYQVVWPVKAVARTRNEPEPPYTDTPVLPAADVLLRHGARILDPQSVVQPALARRRIENSRLGVLETGRAIRYRPTSYVSDDIVVNAGGRGGALIRQLTDQFNELLGNSALRRFGPVRLRPPGDAELRFHEERARTGSPGVSRLKVEVDPEGSMPPADAWTVLQTLRDRLPEESRGDVGLNHLMFAAVAGGVGFSSGHAAGGGVGFSSGHSVGTTEYAIAGLGGRAPVRWLGRPPVRSEVDRRPVVAIIDTGVADHFWFDAPDTDPIVMRFRYVAETGRVEPADETSGGEEFANLIDPLEGLVDPFFGHGTFIAGLIHQICPDARILSIKVMDNDGIVEEAALINALGYLHQRHRNALSTGATSELIDVVSLSLGYYHEADAAGVRYDNSLRHALDALAELGILVVAAAGNDATSQPLLPAGFSPYRNGQLVTTSGSVPLVSVGALNPDGSVALFSNSGEWVACHSPGAALVSTMPLVDSGQRSGVDTGFNPPSEREVGTWRATVDPDSFTGFGTWSGTSFAAPVAAGAAAQAMLTGQKVADPPPSQAEQAQQALSFLGFDLVRQ